MVGCPRAFGDVVYCSVHLDFIIDKIHLCSLSIGNGRPLTTTVAQCSIVHQWLLEKACPLMMFTVTNSIKISAHIRTSSMYMAYGF